MIMMMMMNPKILNYCIFEPFGTELRQSRYLGLHTQKTRISAFVFVIIYRSADKSLARPVRKKARKHIRDARDFKNVETRAVIKFFFPLQGKAPKEIHAILTEILACFLPGGLRIYQHPCTGRGCQFPNFHEMGILCLICTIISGTYF